MGYGYGTPTQQDYGAGYGYPEARRSVPASVRTVAVIQYVGGALMLVAAVLIALVALSGGEAFDENMLPPGAREYIVGAGLAAAALLAFIGLIAIGLGRKLHRGRQWARVLVLILCGLNLALTVYTGFVLVDGQANALFGLVVPVIYLILLNTPAARSFFRGGAAY